MRYSSVLSRTFALHGERIAHKRRVNPLLLGVSRSMPRSPSVIRISVLHIYAAEWAGCSPLYAAAEGSAPWSTKYWNTVVEP